MARRFGSTPFYEILPGNIAQDETMRSCADALDGVLDKSAKAIPGLLIYARLANSPDLQLLPPLARLANIAGGLSALPESLLDLLAWQYHVDAYETATSYETKRELILKSLMLHRRKGTPWAVRNALETAFQCPVEISEWFKYGGEPYFFRVALNITNIEWPESATINAFRIIFEYKNVRSWLDYLITRWQQPVTHHIGAIVRSDTFEKTGLYFTPPPPTPVNNFYSLAILGEVKSAISLYQPLVPASPASEHYGFTLNSFTRSEVKFYMEKPVGIINRGLSQVGLTSTNIQFYGGSNV